MWDSALLSLLILFVTSIYGFQVYDLTSHVHVGLIIMYAALFKVLVYVNVKFRASCKCTVHGWLHGVVIIVNIMNRSNDKKQKIGLLNYFLVLSLYTGL
jgi:hypothetical protein